MSIKKNHVPVMLKEVMDILKPVREGKYVDATFGCGGYSEAILQSTNCNVIAIDQDPDTKIIATKMQEKYNCRLQFYHDNFRNIDSILKEKVDGIVFDIGMSTMQIKDEKRGFSFQYNSPLDMRMNFHNEQLKTAKEVIDNLSEHELSDIIFKYGGERFSRKIAQNITSYNKKIGINTTFDLADVVRKAVGRKKVGKIDAATKTFQALRILVNDELNAFEMALKKSGDLLKKGGKIIVVTFHDLEDRIAKYFFRDNSEKKIAMSKYSKKKNNFKYDNNKMYKIITSKPLVPSSTEIMNNIASRSAKLRAVEKL